MDTNVRLWTSTLIIINIPVYGIFLVLLFSRLIRTKASLTAHMKWTLSLIGLSILLLQHLAISLLLGQAGGGPP